MPTPWSELDRFAQLLDLHRASTPDMSEKQAVYLANMAIQARTTASLLHARYLLQQVVDTKNHHTRQTSSPIPRW